jgi:hypothetical protein
MKSPTRVLILVWLSTLAATAAPTSPASPFSLRDKTLVCWVAPSDLSQRGDSVLTFEKSGAVFDGIVLGTSAPFAQSGTRHAAPEPYAQA